jgi:exopolysaccharide biosynthesis polyprenyl glycosylphosphotransferase
MSSLPQAAVGTLEAVRARALDRAKLQSSTSWATAGVSLDGLMLVAAMTATLLGTRGSNVPVMSLGWLAGFCALVLCFSWLRGMYELRLRLELLDDLRSIVVITSLAAMAVLSLRVLLADGSVDAAEVLRPWAFATVYLAAGRTALNWSQLAARREGEAAKATLIVGAGRIGRLTVRRLREHPELGLRPIGFLDKEPLQDAGDVGVPVLGSSWDLHRVVEEYGVQHVIMTFSTAPHGVLLRLLQDCEEIGVDVSLVPRLYEKMTGRLRIDYIGGLPLLSARRPNPKGWQFAIKHVTDRGTATALLVLLSPVLLLTAIAVRLSMGRPVLFAQERVGRDGTRFAMLKFRSMQLSPDGEQDEFELPDGTAPGGVEGRDRRTRLGVFLRRTCLDELPQLLNVIRGEMSLVGPRPERPEYVSRFEHDVYRYAERHRVKSGITGWAQVNGLRGKTSLADRVEWDNYYIENWSLWLDLKIMLRTVRSVAKTRQAE